MYAIIETGSKQYKVQVGDEIKVEKLPGEPGDSLTFDQVLAISQEGDFKAGNPTLEGASVKATVVEQGRHDKVIIFRYLAKKDMRKKKGHRQPYTQVKIEEINA